VSELPERRDDGSPDENDVVVARDEEENFNQLMVMTTSTLLEIEDPADVTERSEMGPVEEPSDDVNEGDMYPDSDLDDEDDQDASCDDHVIQVRKRDLVDTWNVKSKEDAQVTKDYLKSDTLDTEIETFKMVSMLVKIVMV
jgi:hypothetical protein